jgi:hypothetical protein
MIDTPDWAYLDDVLDDLGMGLDQFRREYPQVNLDHRGLDGRTIVDRRQLGGDEA